jgi:hypothetical protein
VPFTLKVTKGAGAGAEFPFDTTEARLGRTADNDIVVKDSGASRSHARVYQKGTRYFVEDLKSANGTKVNSAVLNGASKEVKNGDTITIGEVTFAFSFAEETAEKPPSVDLAGETMLKEPGDTGDADPDSDEPAAETGDHTSEVESNAPADGTSETPAFNPNETVLKPPPKLDAERVRSTSRRAPVRDAKAVLKDIQNDATVPPQRAPVRQSRSDLQASNNGGTMEMAVPAAVVRRGSKAVAEVDDEKDELTAADKLRMRREAKKSAMGRIALGFGEMPLPARIITGVFGVAFVIGTLGAAIWALAPKPTVKKGAEPTELAGGAPNIEASFGLGQDVTFARPDMKIFNFTAASATRIVGVLHYQARDISKDEVAVSINGYDLGFVPPDTMDPNREVELVLPAQQVKRAGGEVNQLIFDNTHNPPGDDDWRVFNLWLELIAIPDMSQEETVSQVKEDIERSEKFFDQRDIGPDNLFKAWKGYRDAWLKMESMTNRPDELYIVARSQQREMALLLDKRCSMMVLDFQKAMSKSKADQKKARLVAEDMLRYFPSREHRCHALARSLLEDLGGL